MKDEERSTCILKTTQAKVEQSQTGNQRLYSSNYQVDFPFRLVFNLLLFLHLFRAELENNTGFCADKMNAPTLFVMPEYDWSHKQLRGAFTSNDRITTSTVEKSVCWIMFYSRP